MIGKKVIETDPITIAEAKELLIKSAESIDPTYEQNLAIDHVTKFAKLDVETAQKLVGELKEIIKNTQAIKIADVMPGRSCRYSGFCLRRKEVHTKKKN